MVVLAGCEFDRHTVIRTAWIEPDGHFIYRILDQRRRGTRSVEAPGCKLKMVRRCRRGLVVGKFSPLHRGHELLIRHAHNSCDELIIISYSNPEFAGCEASRREQWLAEIFPDVRRLVATDDLLREHVRGNAEFSAVPANGAAEATHRDFCAFLLESFTENDVDAVFTSEDYGTGFASHLTERFRARYRRVAPVEHVPVDRDRVMVPISGSQIRADIHAHRNW